MLRPIIHNNGYVYNRIDKRVARRLYNEGYIITMLGIKQRITGYVQMCKDFHGGTFDGIVNAWCFYNECYYGRPCFYIEEPADK